MKTNPEAMSPNDLCMCHKKRSEHIGPAFDCPVFAKPYTFTLDPNAIGELQEQIDEVQEKP